VTDAKPTLLVVGPVPPPAFGVAKATELMVHSRTLAASFNVVHLDTSDPQGFAKMGQLTVENVVLAFRHILHLLGVLIRQRPDIVLLTVSQGRLGLVRDSLVAGLSRALGARTAAYLRGSGYASIPTEQGRLAGWIARLIVKHSAVTFVLGEGLVAPNGCPPAVAAGHTGLRDQSHPVIAYVGRLSSEKGLGDIIEAMRSLAPRVPGVEFALQGEWDSPEYGAQMVAKVGTYGLSDVVRFGGPASPEERADLLTRAWVLVLPSHSEGQPWAILEALSAGVPVVGTDTGAVAETVQDGVCGFVVPVGDSDALAAGLTTILEDDRLWSQMSRAALDRYRDCYSMERSHGALATALLSVVSDDSPGLQTPVSSAEDVVSWFSRHAQEFDRRYAKHPLFKQRTALWERLIVESCPPGCRVLDVGCGSGVFTVVAALRGAHVTAVDPSREMLDLCARRCEALGLSGCEFVQSTVEQLESKVARQFDVVLGSSVFEYVDDLATCLDIIGRLSRPGATLVVSLPNSGSLIRMLEKISYRLFARPEYFGLVKTSMTPDGLLSVMTSAGFSPRQVHFTGAPPWLARATRLSSVGRRVATMTVVVATRIDSATEDAS
jgi:glycosyltransferase involved in cell wall biosynthesis/2-polyprenyl-3-methyl-5-hydroxy-6-metoxy-1,4-benzoquinol methylase